MTGRLSIVLTARPGTASGDLETALRSATVKLRDAGWGASAAVAVEPDPFLGTAHRAEVPDRVDGLLSWDLAASSAGSSAGPELGTVVAEVVERLGEQIDPARSGLLHGVQHVVVEGDGPLHISFALRRRPSMSHAEFSDYWLNSHGRLASDAAARRRPSTGYRQLHADPGVSGALAASAGLGVGDYDGLVSSDHLTAERMKKIFSHPAVADTALADERNFIDHRRSAIGLLRKL
jgi:hypothetical protein